MAVGGLVRDPGEYRGTVSVSLATEEEDHLVRVT